MQIFSNWWKAMWRSALKMLWDLAEESSANFATSTSSHLSIKVFSFLSSRERVSREEKQIWSEFKCRAYSFFFSFTAYHYHFFTFNSCDNAYQHTAVFTSLRYPDFKETKKKYSLTKISIYRVSESICRYSWIRFGASATTSLQLKTRS